MSQTLIPFIISPSAITFYLDWQPVSFTSDSIEYEQALKILYDYTLSDTERQQSLAALKNVRTEAHERRWDRVKSLSPDIDVSEDDQILWRGQPIENSLAQRMLKLYKEDLDIEPLVNFLTNLQQNPSNRVVEHLYEFLEYGKIPITSDGCFLAYKAISADWFSIASGKDGKRLRNMIGDTVEMPRNQVDENPDHACSHGLHVCSFEYLPFFAHDNGHVVVCKINPKDVVAIPRDYNNTKMRVCKYEVVGEVEGWYESRRNFLSDSPFNDSYDGTEKGENNFATDWDFDSLEPDGLPNLDEFDEPNRYDVLGRPPGKFNKDDFVWLDSKGTITTGMRALQDWVGVDDYAEVQLVDTTNGALIMTVVNGNIHKA